MVTEVAIIKAVSPTVRLFVTKVEIIIGCATARPFLEVLYGTATFSIIPDRHEFIVSGTKTLREM